MRDTVKMRALPPEAPAQQASGLARFVDWFKINREPLGAIALAVSTFARALLWLPHHTEIADALKGLADAVMVLGALTYGAGAFKSDKGKLQDIHTEIKRRSGQIPAFERRGN